MLPEFNPVLSLTPEQYRIFLETGKGLSTREIASLPGHRKSRKTIESHQLGIQKKLNLNSINQLRVFSARFQVLGVERTRLAKPLRYTWPEQIGI